MLLLFLPGTLAGMLNQKKLRDRPWVRRIHYPWLVKGYGRLLYNVAYEPISYILYTIVTNIDAKRTSALLIVFFSCIIFLSFPIILNSNAFLLFNPDRFHRLDSREDRLYAFHYEDRRPANKTIMRPVIPSEQIERPFLRIFIPLTQREEAVLDILCGEYQSAEDLSGDENRRARRAFRRQCLRRYYSLRIDDTPVSDYDLHLYEHPNRGEEGVLIHCNIESLASGMHTLRIEYNYKKENGEPKVSLLPFWYAGN